MTLFIFKWKEQDWVNGCVWNVDVVVPNAFSVSVRRIIGLILGCWASEICMRIYWSGIEC